MKERIHWIDILRAIAMIAVVLGHTLRGGSVQTYLYSFHFALFMFISGLVASERKESYGQFLKHNLQRLVVPYLAFGLISIIIYQLLGKIAAGALGEQINGSFLENIGWLLYGSSRNGHMDYNHPLWALACLFVCNHFFYLLKLAGHHLKNDKAVRLTALVVFAILGYLNCQWDLVLPWHIETAFTMMVFYLSGSLLKGFLNNLDGKLAILLAGAIVLIIAGGTLGRLNGRIMYSGNVYNNLALFYGGAFASIFGYLLLAKAVNRQPQLEYVGRRTLSILVMHKFPILFFQTIVPFTRGPLKENNLPVAIAVTVISLVLCLAADWIILKVCPVIIGERTASEKQ